MAESLVFNKKQHCMHLYQAKHGCFLNLFIITPFLKIKAKYLMVLRFIPFFVTGHVSEPF